MQRQASLAKAAEPLQIKYPRNFTGQKSDPDATEILISTRMGLYTIDEIRVIEVYLSTLPYAQKLSFGTVLIDQDDLLLNANHDQIDQTEQSIGYPNSRTAPGGGERSLRERVLILRENGYYGNGGVALLEGAK